MKKNRNQSTDAARLRRRAEETLSASEARYRRLFETARDGILILDAETGMVVDVNSFLIKMLGYSHEAFLGKKVWELGFFKDIVANQDNFAELQQKGYIRYGDMPLETSDGRRVEVEFVSSLYLVNHQKVIQCNIRDITGRKQAEEKIRRLATVVRDSSDAITIQDFDGRITAWNRGAELMYGYSEAEALLANIERLTAPGKVEEQKEFTRRLMAGEAITAFETQRLTKDGRVLEVWLTVTKLMDDAGKPVGIASTERDITERKRAHAALEQCKRNFQNILQGSPDGMVIVDSNGLIVFANAAAADVFGRPLEQLLGTSFDQPIISGQNTELAVVNPAGKSMVVEMRMIQTLWQENPACLVSLRDVTHRKHNEQQLRLAGTELRRVNQNLVTRNAEIQNFYHTLSHELKTPLTSAREFVSIVMDGLAGPLTETQLEYLGIAKESCDQLRRYINDMLDVTRLETGKLSIEFQVVPLAALVERVVEMLAPAAAGKGISLSCDCQPDLPAVPLDQQRILQALTNLTTNAIKFTPAGGQIRLSLSQAPTDPKCLQVAVRDTGRGIPKDQLDMIFNRLYQVTGDDQSAESPRGLGLGLYICQELVQLHGGHIWVESEPGRGSTFTFTIPKCQTPASLDVLVVDDEAAIRDPLCQLFEKNGYHVALAGGGAEALQLMRQQLPALVILDLQMPDMDGAETLEHIRKEWGEIPVIIHTSHPEGDLMNRALKCAPFTVLAKPDTSEHILNVVHNLVRWDHKTAGGTKASRLPEREGLRLRPVNTPSYNLQLEP
jgi:PAS domain S-box-containing protein